VNEKQREPCELTSRVLQAYSRGFNDGNQGDYFPGRLDKAAYDRGHTDGEKHGPRKGRPWTLAELKAMK
jgi:hypothetical protein